MSKTTSLDELSSFSQNEQKIIQNLGLVAKTESKPSKKSIDFILNYSKALSVRKTKLLGNVENLLN